MAALTVRRLLLLTGIVLGLTWLTLAARGPALYDGLPLTNEPYRYLHPPGMASTPTPGSAETMLPVSAGRSQAFELDTGETGPQAQLVASDGALGVPTGVTTIDVRIDPVDPPTTMPAGSIDGNVYRVTATAGGKPVDLVAGAACSVTLRGTGAQGSPLFEEFSGGRWTRLTTVDSGNPGLYSANLAQLGEVALVLPSRPAPGASSGTSPPSGAGTSSLPVAAVIVAGVVLMLIGFVGAVRVQRLRRFRAAGAHRGRPNRRR